MRLFAITCFCLALACQVVCAQTASISGRVVDSESQEPLPFANIFINHTTFGTASDDKGFFRLTNIPAGQVEIVFSYVGYQSVQTKVSLIDNQSVEIKVKLIEDKRLLENIHVQGTRDEKWENQLKKFSTFFLGETKGFLTCRITNPWVLDFKEGVAESNSVMFAEASEPIMIENLFLGYNIAYFLKRFTVNDKSFVIQGNVRFEEMVTTDRQLAKRWEENRLRTYKGSSRHLFSALVNRRQKAEGFYLYSDKPEFTNSMVKSNLFSRELGKSVEELDSSQIKVVDIKPGEIRLVLRKRVEVHYVKGKARSKTYDDMDFPVSWVELKNGTIDVDSRGNPLDPENMTTDGQMGKGRVSELLPYDYNPSQTAVLLQKTDVIKPSRWDDLAEHVYITTDKPYYYPGEIIWFKAFMRYGNQQKMDTLSRVLHVELIGPDKKVIQSKEYFIDRGMTTGDIFLPESITPGAHYIRAYTKWMRNYGDENLYVKHLPVLSVFDKVIPSPPRVATLHSNSQVGITPDKETYTTREKISLMVKIKGDSGQSRPFDLSMSVVDGALVSPLTGGRTILEEFSRRGPSLKKAARATYPIEYGISLSGRVRSKGERKEKFIVTIIQGKNDDIDAVATDSVGNFYINGFQFTDSAEFAFQSKNLRGKLAGAVVLDRQEYPLLTDLPPAISVSVEKKENPQRPVLRDDQSRMLDEIEVKSTRLEDYYDGKRIAPPDFTIRGDDMVKEKFGTILSALKAKIPGLRVIPITENGMLRYMIQFNLSMSAQEPLLVINGMRLSSPMGIYQRLMELNPNDIDFIDVSRFNGSMEFGVPATSGFISVYTKDRQGIRPSASFNKEYFQMLNVNGYSVPLVFPSPDYSKMHGNNDKIDFRSTIYWEPVGPL